MTLHYWPWWLGGTFLALVAVGYPWLTGAALGVSGAVARLLPRGRTANSTDTQPADGRRGVVASVNAPSLGLNETPGCGTAVAAVGAESVPPAARKANLVFILAVAAGGAIGSLSGGHSWGAMQLAPEFHRLFGSGLTAALVLFGGGLLVGLGTRLSGGCTSGHGLSGCGRFQPASLVATAVFFGVAIVTSFILDYLLK